ncbi:TPR-repeat-containing protein [Histomonas meleagridis]|uniref:TPR-repeat-containing protein n=1 Tax=Histomonas meleagridis TaxID=135588 RepID=UPI0035598D2F|nr:TPR-repeat-containing protein [Histomonas meleagridis]KAH0797324.1 TPR-repeat-containing protein [Histomonas meleagridis]
MLAVVLLLTHTFSLPGTITITATVNKSFAAGKGGTYLEWTNLSGTNTYYKLFQKSQDENGEWTEWKQISTYQEGTEVRVLNVYPSQVDGFNGDKSSNCGSYNTYNVNFKFDIDGTTKTLPKSASLKVWMEGGNINGGSHIEAAGRDQKTGKQLIYVTLMSINDFEYNAAHNPNFIYDYDVTFFGTWDANAGYNIKKETAKGLLLDYIKKGYGVIAGHDSICYIFRVNGESRSLNTIREYFGIKASTEDVYGSDGKKISYGWIYSTTVSIQRKGLLTNYPYEIGDIGTTLTIPQAHTTDNACTGDVWLSFNTNGLSEDRYGNKHNFYLTTKNNTAFLQTGHSNCESSSDERKIIANTIYYLKQRTFDNFASDHSSQDFAAPTIRLVYLQDEYCVQLEPLDKGSKYKFMVQAIRRTDESLYAQSDEAQVTVTTDIKEIRYAVMKKTDEPTIADLVNTTTESKVYLTHDEIMGNNYFYAAAIDGAGNIGTIEGVEIKIPTESPSKSPSPSMSPTETPSRSPLPTPTPLPPTTPPPTPEATPMASPTRSPSRSFPPYLSSDQYSEWLRQQQEDEDRKRMTYYIAGGVAIGVVAIVIAAVAVFLKFGSHPKIAEIGEGYNAHVEKDSTVNYDNPLYNEAADDPFADDFTVQRE